MESMETLITQIQGLSSSADDLSHLHSLLKQAEESLQSQANQLSCYLQQLDPSQHSLGFLYILEAHTCGPISSEQSQEFLISVANFIDSCSSEQIRLAPDKFISLCKRYKDHIIQLQVPIQGIASLRTAVCKLQSSTEHLTAIHPYFLLLCLLAKCYKAGLSILEEHIFEIDEPKDFFLYCYYGGMINIGLKRFEKAAECLHNAITAPATSLNSITIEAYKKYVLVSLIHNGQLPNFPKYATSLVQRNLKSYTQPYIELANSYATGKISELEQCLKTHREKFESDANLGLVKQVISSLYKRNIQRLTQTYLTLSLQDIANTVQLESSKHAEMHVLQMIQDGEIFATINQKDGMVSFHEDPEQYKTCEMIEHIDSSIQRLMALSKKLNSMDEQLSCDSLYLTKSNRERTKFDFDDFDAVPQKYLL